jgi:carboxymethylenebutenolidase
MIEDPPSAAETHAPEPLSRREFASLSLAAGVAGAIVTAPASAAADVRATQVAFHTPAGTCDAALVHPVGKRPRPAAILFVDVFGLRPTMVDMAKRLAANGFTVLVPNPYYRSTKAPGISHDFDFQSAADRARLATLRAPLTNEGVMQDVTAYVAWLDTQPFVDRQAPIGVFGYCMGGPMTMQAAAALPDRIRAGASFHGGGLVTDGPDSPHLLVPQIKANFYFAIAASDDQRQPDAKTKLDAAFQAAGQRARIEVYAGTIHGWCVKDMPLQAGKPIYDEPQAERAWGDLVSLYQTMLVPA